MMNIKASLIVSMICVAMFVSAWAAGTTPPASAPVSMPASSTAPASQPTSATAARDVLLLIDATGSMMAAMDDYIKDQCLTDIRTLSQSDHACLIVVGGTQKKAERDKSVPAKTSGWFDASIDNKVKAAQYTLSLIAQGPGDITAELARAVSNLAARPKKETREIVMYFDRVDSDKNRNVLTAEIRKCLAAGIKVTIHVYDFESSKSHFDADLSAEITKAGGHVYLEERDGRDPQFDLNTMISPAEQEAKLKNYLDGKKQ